MFQYFPNSIYIIFKKKTFYFVLLQQPCILYIQSSGMWVNSNNMHIINANIKCNLKFCLQNIMKTPPRLVDSMSENSNRARTTGNPDLTSLRGSLIVVVYLQMRIGMGNGVCHFIVHCVRSAIEIAFDFPFRQN